ncbi:hypothetical protein [Georgenia yuyongxinii]|uniref:Uncharacterized protein n=1 Tax=Georgenia yuyongxinii TaxID=2589797 RepID=A0A552WYX9_9MICO|nr:hypothetical protein [Georgenia yuyongxinii]TRW47543.1 hypothetical protein FJ693_00050 [Georgenia yuyongxinii]
MSTTMDSEPPRGTLTERIRSAKSKQVAVTPREVAIARVRVAADRSTGRETPKWIVKLANAKS